MMHKFTHEKQGSRNRTDAEHGTRPPSHQRAVSDPAAQRRVAQLEALQEVANRSPRSIAANRMQERADVRRAEPVQRLVQLQSRLDANNNMGGWLELADRASVATTRRFGQILPEAPAGDVVQRVIKYDKTTGQFETTSRRPGWRKFLKASVADEYNQFFGTSLGATSRLPSTDRDHRISFAAIQELVCDYCNQDATKTELEELTDALYDATTTEYDNMVSARDDLEGEVPGGNPNTIRLYANYLLGLLNSATQNVSPGDASINRGIGKAPDFAFDASPKGRHTVMTPRSDQIFRAYEPRGRVDSFPRTPGGTVRSSHHHTSYGAVRDRIWDPKQQRYHPY